MCYLTEEQALLLTKVNANDAIWSVVTALRGPDSYRDYTHLHKFATTSVIRRKALKFTTDDIRITSETGIQVMYEQKPTTIDMYIAVGGYVGPDQQLFVDLRKTLIQDYSHFMQHAKGRLQGARTEVGRTQPIAEGPTEYRRLMHQTVPSPSKKEKHNGSNKR
jgi:hypothetical protein